MLTLLLWKLMKQGPKLWHFYQLMLNILVSWWRGVWYCSFRKYSGHFGEGQIIKPSTGRKEITKILVSEQITETVSLSFNFPKPFFLFILAFYWTFWKLKYRKGLVVVETNRKNFTYRYMLEFFLDHIVTHSFFLCI